MDLQTCNSLPFALPFRLCSLCRRFCIYSALTIAPFRSTFPSCLSSFPFILFLSFLSFSRLLRPSPQQLHAWQQYGRCTLQHQSNQTNCLCTGTLKVIQARTRLNSPQKTIPVLNPFSATTHQVTKLYVGAPRGPLHEVRSTRLAMWRTRNLN